MSEQVGIVASVIVGLIAVALLLSYGVYIFYQASASVFDLGLPANSTANATATAVIANTWAAFSILSPVPLLMGAGAIITVLLAAFLWIRAQ